MSDKKLTKQETISMLNEIISIFDWVNDTLDTLFTKHLAEAERQGYDINRKPGDCSRLKKLDR